MEGREGVRRAGATKLLYESHQMRRASVSEGSERKCR